MKWIACFVIALLAGSSSGEVKAQELTALPCAQAETCGKDIGKRPARAAGTSVVSVVVSADGEPKEVKLSSSSGDEELDKWTVEYAASCRYTPGKRDGKAVEASTKLALRWVL